MARDMGWVDEAREAAQERVPEPIVTVGFLQPAGSWGSLGISYLSGVAGTLLQAEAMMIGGGFNDALLAEIAPGAT